MDDGGYLLASQEKRIAAAMQAILAYLDEHPHAADTRRGVELWLRDMPDTPSPEVVGRALARLVERGDIKARRIADTVVFGSARQGPKKHEKR